MFLGGVIFQGRGAHRALGGEGHGTYTPPGDFLLIWCVTSSLLYKGPLFVDIFMTPPMLTYFKHIGEGSDKGVLAHLVSL